jgi:deoxyribonuclease V
MQINHLHDWPSTETEAIAIQQTLSSKVDVSRKLESFVYIAGCDLAYHLTEPIAFAAVVLIYTGITIVPRSAFTS